MRYDTRANTQGVSRYSVAIILSDKSKSKEYPKGSVTESHTSASSGLYFITL